MKNGLTRFRERRIEQRLRSVEGKPEELEAGDFILAAAEACNGVNFPEGAEPYDSYWNSKDDCRNCMTDVCHARFAHEILTELGYDHVYVETDGGHNDVNRIDVKVAR